MRIQLRSPASTGLPLFLSISLSGAGRAAGPAQFALNAPLSGTRESRGENNPFACSKCTKPRREQEQEQATGRHKRKIEMISPVDGSRLSQPHALIYKLRFAFRAASWALWPQIFWPCPSGPGLVSLDFGLTQNLLHTKASPRGWIFVEFPNSAQRGFVFAGFQINCLMLMLLRAPICIAISRKIEVKKKAFCKARFASEIPGKAALGNLEVECCEHPLLCGATAPALPLS